MKKILVITALTTIAFAASLTAIAVNTRQALAATHHQTVVRHTLVVAMHDPGCHSFLVHGKYTRSAVEPGAVRVVNRDEAKLKVASHTGARYIPVGKSLVVRHGRYVVTMVGQAADDNHLKLTVR
jgi:hypothetical protein